jgi:hypothetical protein
VTAWSVELRRDGEPIVTAPVDDYIAAQVLAETTVALWGGRVSVVNAVTAQRRADAPLPDPTIFDQLEEAVA